MSTTDQAICLRKNDYSETSQVVSFLTRAGGVVRLIAKGAKRPKSKSGGALDLLSEGECVYAGGRRETLGTLMEFAETVTRPLLRRDLRRLNCGLYMLELCGAMLAEGDPHPEVFDLLHNALHRLGQEDSAPQAVLAYFQLRLVRHVGLLGPLGECVSCGGPADTAGVCFSSSAGGLLCRDCEPSATEKRPITPAAMTGLAVLAAAEAGKRPKMTPAAAAAVNALLAYHIEYQFGRRLKMARHALAQ